MSLALRHRLGTKYKQVHVYTHRTLVGFSINVTHRMMLKWQFFYIFISAILVVHGCINMTEIIKRYFSDDSAKHTMFVANQSHMADSD